MVRRLPFVATAGDAARALPSRPSTTAKAPVIRTLAPIPENAAARDTDLEQWFGQRGLLAVGVAALLIAAAFFLKYAIDRGWIAPLVRSLGAILAGVGVAAWGHERIGKGMRRYGASLIGAGGGLAYLGLWAAAGPYAPGERPVGLALLPLTTRPGTGAPARPR